MGFRAIAGSRFTIRGWLRFTFLIAFLLSFKWTYYAPYYEARGTIIVQHPILGIGGFASWAGPRFRHKYGPEVGVRWGENHSARVYWDWYYGGLFTFRFYHS